MKMRRCLTVAQFPRSTANKQNAQDLSGQRNNRIARLVQQRPLQSAQRPSAGPRWPRQLDARHPSGVALAPEQTRPRLGRVLLVGVGVEFGQHRESLVGR